MNSVKNNKPQNKTVDTKVVLQYNQPQYLFCELAPSYQNLMEFEIALIVDHFSARNRAAIFLHEPYFEM
ncbi:MAG: hypothetical protein ACRBHB_23575 [Arenicella sp.]